MFCRRFVFAVGVLPIVACLMIATGCGSDGNALPGPTPTPTPTPTPVLPTVQFTAEPSTVLAGDFTTIAWQTSGATAVTVVPNLNEDDDGTDLPLSGSRTIVAIETTTYVLTATGPEGSSTASVTVTVTPRAPTITLTVSPDSIIRGQSATLNWTSENATSISIEPGVGTFQEPNGSVQISPEATTTYTATATGTGGTTQATVTVTVAEPGELAVTLSAVPSSIAPGGTSTLTWSTQNAASVRIEPGVGAVALNGSVEVTPSATTTYTATATGPLGNTATATGRVTVIPGGNLNVIKHIIFFVQENRSFDNYFAKLQEYRESKGVSGEVEGFDPDIEMFDFFGHAVKPFHQRTVRTENLSPAWNESHFYANFRNGAFQMDSWMKQQNPSIPSTIDPHYTRTMGYYDCTDIPFYCDLSTYFAISDRFFSSVMSGTVVNRAYLFSATSQGMIRPSDPFPVEAPTIFRKLTEAGIRWRYYYQDGSVFLANYTKPGGCPECDWDKYMTHVWSISNYYDILSRPTADQDLPQVVFIQHSSGEKGPETALDEHPGHHVQRGVAQSEQILRALMNSAAWPSSVFILSHDEGGGLYDHVPPYEVSNPDGIAPMLREGDVGAYDNFTYSGFRVPLIVVSPWVRPGYVSHVNREFTSILKLIETRFNLAPLTQRDAEADDMLEMFDLTQPRMLNPPPIAVQPIDGVDDIRLEGDPNHPN